MAEFPAEREPLSLEERIENMKQQIRSTHESYHNDYDVLAELVQNAVDAVAQRKREDSGYSAHIAICIDERHRLIEVSDDGVGMSKDELNRSVRLNESSKRNNEIDKITIGEKGIGLSFSIFESNRVLIQTNNDSECSEATADGAWDWVNNSDNKNTFTINVATTNGGFSRGTKVTLSEISDLNSFFKLSTKQLEFILRTRTAIGNTEHIWVKDQSAIDVTLKHIRTDVKEVESIKIKNKYWLLDDVSKGSIVSAQEFQDKYSSTKTTDAQKREYLRGKYVTYTGTKEVGKRVVRYFAYFAPNGDDWGKRSKNNNLDISENEDLNYARFSQGVTLSVKGMPTGIPVSTSNLKGASGYISRMFMIIEDPGLTFDTGRKTVASRTIGMYHQLSDKVYRNYNNVIQKWVKNDSKPRAEETSTSAKFKEIRREIPLSYKNTSFKFLPNQEGTVSAMFFEQVGKGTFPGLNLYQHGYNNIYDIYAEYGDDDIVLEFKKQLSDFFNDVKEEIKLWNDVDYLIIYDSLTDEDVHDANKESISLVRFSNLDEKHLCATASLATDYTQPIYVISIEDILKNS